MCCRRPVELGAAQRAEPGGAAHQGHAGGGGARVGVLRGTRLHRQHPHALCGGMSTISSARVCSSPLPVGVTTAPPST